MSTIGKSLKSGKLTHTIFPKIDFATHYVLANYGQW